MTQPEETGGDRRPIHVLVVDDSAVVRQFMTGLLSQEPGMEATVAADPLIALVRWSSADPM